MYKSNLEMQEPASLASASLCSSLEGDDGSATQTILMGDDDTDTMIGSSEGNETDDDISNSSAGEDDRHSEQFRFRLRNIKRIMKTLMKRHGGSTRHPRVTKMIHKLEEMNPTRRPAKSHLLVGDFIAHSSPDFPGRLGNVSKRRKAHNMAFDQHEDADADDQVVQYTLGRLSFGIFQPHNLVCTVRAVRNSIQVCDDEELLKEMGSHDFADDASKGDLQTFFYPIIIDLTIHTPHGIDLEAEMRHEALCHEMPDQDTRLGVIFLGGSLMPALSVRNDPKLMAIWKETFANAYKTADEERSYMGWILRLAMTWWLQLSTPSDEDAEKSAMHCVKYEMKRRPRGHLDVLYLDEELRVTRGNRGTLIVVEKMSFASGEVGMSPSHPAASSSSPPVPHPSH